MTLLEKIRQAKLYKLLFGDDVTLGHPQKPTKPIKPVDKDRPTT